MKPSVFVALLTLTTWAGTLVLLTRLFDWRAAAIMLVSQVVVLGLEVGRASLKEGGE